MNGSDNRTGKNGVTHDFAADLAARRDKLRRKMFGEPDFSVEEISIASQDGVAHNAPVVLAARAHFPTRFGMFELYGFVDRRNDKEHTAVVKGNIAGAIDCPVRVHSQCHTGDVWGSLRCDCRDQLESALEYISKQDRGAVVYLKQEGRGIGLVNKIRAYHLQDLGLDTIEANEYLGFPAEARSYDVAAEILRTLGVRSVALITNNPDKITKLTEEGIEITRRIPLVIPWNKHNETYMQTKQESMGHLF